VTDLDSLTQTELLAVALEATRRGDAGHALVCLKEAAGRADASAEACFMLGSEYAQIGLVDDALRQLGRAASLGPDFAIAHFQLGLLQLTAGQPEQAREAWRGLDGLAADAPLAWFRRGLEHLIRDEFQACVQALEEGIRRNLANPALNVDMQGVVNRVQALPAEVLGAKPGETEGGSHLFLHAYEAGKLH